MFFTTLSNHLTFLQDSGDDSLPLEALTRDELLGWIGEREIEPTEPLGKRAQKKGESDVFFLEQISN